MPRARRTGRRDAPRVGVDFHAVDGIFQGVRSHLLSLYPHVCRARPDVEFYFFLEGVDALRRDPAFDLPNVHTVPMPGRDPVRRLLWQLPRLEREHDLDVLHTQYVAPPRLRATSVVTLHDVLFLSHPQFFTPFFRLRSRVLMKYSARRAGHVFTVSEWSRREILEHYALPEARVSVVRNAVDHQRFRPEEDAGEHADARDRIEDLGLVPGHYLLTVGRLEPRKNHSGLLRAFALLPTDVPPLVVAGPRHFGYEEALRLVDELGLAQRVRFLHDVGDDLLPALYRHARLFVFPSWAEGFGLPPLEAMASGVPVIVARGSALSEVTEGAGVLVDPADPVEIAAALRRVLADESLARHLAHRGRQRALQFDWAAEGRRAGDVYARLLAA
jgi:glycosyltransferase involved in cell wall biosynthesis